MFRSAACIADTFFLCDDAFISFRYARNLIEGNGLVFNRVAGKGLRQVQLAVRIGQQG